MNKVRIADIGLVEAAKRLVPMTVLAGRVACDIQDALLAGRVKNMLSKDDEEGYNKQALTDADLVCSNLVGSAALTQFADLSYVSEEAKADNVSKYFPSRTPFTMVFDPINGTSYLKDGKKCFENIYTLCDADGGKVLNTKRAIVINLPRYDKVFVGDDRAVWMADTSKVGFDGTADLDLRPYHIQLGAKSGVYVSVSLKDRLADIQAAGLNARVAHHVYKEYGINDPDWGFVPAGILDGRVEAFAIAGIDLMDSLAVAYLAQGAGAHVLIEGYHPETHIADLCIAAIDKGQFDTLCQVLAPLRRNPT